MNAGFKIISLPKITDPRGNLSFAEGQTHIPFDIARVYYLYDIPSGATRAGHAHYKLQQLMIALAGSFIVCLTDGKDEVEIQLSQPDSGLLLLNPMLWRAIRSFSGNAVCLVLASMVYDESDYIRNYDDYLRIMEARR